MNNLLPGTLRCLKNLVENSFKRLIDYIEEQTSFRCQYYKENPLKRRIKVRLRALSLQSFEEYYYFLKQNPGELQTLLSTLTINLSYFFRNPETFEYLEKFIFPDFKRSLEPLVFWSAGCAHGEEPYSLAISAAEHSLLPRVQIYGTDIDQEVLRYAKQGIFSRIVFEYTPERILQKYFKKNNNDYLLVESIRQRVTFINNDLFESPPFGLCDLIMCRNVLIYLDRSAQSMIMRNFYDQLKPYGYLVIGKAELLLGIPEVKLFEVINRAEHIYQKSV